MSGRSEAGVTHAMIESFGDIVFHLSHNVQRRTGDPVRTLDFAAIERQRSDLGLADAEIATRVGLTPTQVTYIRNVMEWRRFERGHYRRLQSLGGGRRYRAEGDSQAREQRSRYPRSLALREALAYDPDLARRYVEGGWWRGDTLRGWVERWAADTPDAPALVHADGLLSYGAFAERVRRLAAALYSLGLRKGDVVAVGLPNLPEYLVAYGAIAHLGGVMTTLYLSHRELEMRSILGHSGARAMICATDVRGFGAAAAAVRLKRELPDLDHVVNLGAPVPGARPLGELLSQSVGDLRTETPTAGDPLLLLYTSGTTSSPKAVPHSSHTILSNGCAGVLEHQLCADDRMLSAAPFGHLFGLYSFHLALAAGASVALLPTFSPPALLETLGETLSTVLFAAPAHLLACLEKETFAGATLPSLRLAILSGAAVPESLPNDLVAALPGCEVSQLWGMTETQAGLYTRPGDPPSVVATSAGRPSPGTEARIAGEDGSERPVGEVGELLVRGPLLFPGYFENEDANRNAFCADGYFRTGDLARCDARGNIAIVGRAAEVINRGGVKYNPREVEELLGAHPKLRQAAIVPMSDPVLGERACCFVELAGDAAVDLEELCAFLRSRGIDKTKLPERLEIVDAMPLTPNRKIIKSRLAERLVAGTKD